MSKDNFTEPLIAEVKAAEMLDVSKRTLQGLRSRGGGPRFVKMTPRGGVRYRRSDLEAWVEERLQISTSDAWELRKRQE